MGGDLTAREVLAEEMARQHDEDNAEYAARFYLDDADGLVRALAAAGWRLERDEQWEWGVDDAPGSDPSECRNERRAREIAAQFGVQVVRRRRVGRWEMADA